jgi:hypothetical protein
MRVSDSADCLSSSVRRAAEGAAPIGPLRDVVNSSNQFIYQEVVGLAETWRATVPSPLVGPMSPRLPARRRP